MLNQVVLLTGASGFVGRAVITNSAATGCRIRAAVRNFRSAQLIAPSSMHFADSMQSYAPSTDLTGLSTDMVRSARSSEPLAQIPDPFAQSINSSAQSADGKTGAIASQGYVDYVPLPDLSHSIDWTPLLEGVDAVVHLAGIAHSGPGIPDEVYDRVNRAATAELATAAARAGVKRFVFMSSVRAQSGPSAETILTETDEPKPTDAYGHSKLAAEEAVRASGMPFTILRPVLVCGPGAKGNLASLVRLADTPWPLPFASLEARRSLVSLDNLVAAIRFVLQTETRQGETYLVADPDPLTIADMIATLRRALNRPPRLFAAPPTLMGIAARALGRAEDWERLSGSLIVDSTKLQRAGFRPVVSLQQGLAAMAQAASPRHPEPCRGARDG